MRTLPIVVAGAVCAALAFAAPATAATAHPAYKLARGSCKTGYVGALKTVKVHKKTERYVVCSWNPAKFSTGKYKASQSCPSSFVGASATTKTKATIKCEKVGKLYKWVQTKAAPETTTVQLHPVSTPPPTLPPTTPTVIPVRAAIDPSYTQDSVDPYKVTFNYSASTQDSLPDGTLALTIFQHGAVSNAGGCTMNVGGSILGGTCEVTIPAWGQYDLVTTYSGGTDVSATSGTETVDIEPPAPTPLIVTGTWNTATVSEAITDSGATLTIISNFEGATTVAVTDNLGDTCQATVTGGTATCTIAAPTYPTVPTTATLNYPGGTTIVSEQTVTPWGVPEAQQVTTEWPAQTISEPITVTDTRTPPATVSYATSGVIRTPSNVTVDNYATGSVPTTINIPVGDKLLLLGMVSGSLPTDTQPLGGTSFTITPGTENTDWTDLNIDYGANTDIPGTPNCASVTNNPGEAWGECQMIFNTRGTYAVKLGYVSADSNYADDQNGPSFTVVVN